tara:strand:+ start:343 stop:888 length:546 start_codon:yes stop_codon:yes gene_type:complete
MSIFKDIRQVVKTGQEPFQWYRNRIKEFGAPSQRELLRDGRLAGRFHVGRLNMFVYDPKLKAKLPYYDTFPLVLPIKRYSDGFLGINFHYLPYALRARLLEQVMKIGGRGSKEDMQIIAGWSKLDRVRLIKPTVKRYLNNHVRSRFRRIDSEDFVTAIMLPIQRFKKGSASTIWADSRKMI